MGVVASINCGPTFADQTRAPAEVLSRTRIQRRSGLSLRLLAGASQLNYRPYHPFHLPNGTLSANLQRSKSFEITKHPNIFGDLESKYTQFLAQPSITADHWASFPKPVPLRLTCEAVDQLLQVGFIYCMFHDFSWTSGLSWVLLDS